VTAGTTRTAPTRTVPQQTTPRGIHARTTSVHPVAWWVFALLLAATADRTTNPLLLGALLAAVAFTVLSCRPTGPAAPGWSRGFGAFFKLALLVLAIRTVFHVLLGSGDGPPILFTLPTVHLPSWATGIRIGGPVSATGLVGTLYAALSLAVLLCCVGAAVALADPRRLLASLPGALYEVGVAVVVALSLAPELLSGAQRVRRARELRGDAATGRGPVAAARSWTRLALPVLADATDSALVLAASMDGRGYGRTPEVSRLSRAVTSGAVLVGLIGLALGIYCLLDDSAPIPVTVSILLAGVVACVLGLSFGSARVQRTRFRKESWSWRDALVIVSAAVPLAGSIISEQLHVQLDVLDPLTLPALPLLPFLTTLAAALPGVLIPRTTA
jgi:energy-coupling factor transport system permease protein